MTTKNKNIIFYEPFAQYFCLSVIDSSLKLLIFSDVGNILSNAIIADPLL